MVFIQRIEYNKKIMVMDNTENIKYEINSKRRLQAFWKCNGDFIIVRGSVPGTYKRLIKLRTQIRNMPKKITKPIF